jgi:hypothetical protein
MHVNRKINNAAEAVSRYPLLQLHPTVPAYPVVVQGITSQQLYLFHRAAIILCLKLALSFQRVTTIGNEHDPG